MARRARAAAATQLRLCHRRPRYHGRGRRRGLRAVVSVTPMTHIPHIPPRRSEVACDSLMA
jgi:hypothetical protein